MVLFNKILNILSPNFLDKEPIGEINDKDLLAAIDKVRMADTIEDSMQTALEILSEKFDSKRLSTYMFYSRIFERDTDRLWKRKGFMHCNQQNYLFRVLMVKSGVLKDSQIELGHSLVWYVSPHQYLKVRVGDRLIAVDPWNFGRGAVLGKYASGFGMKSL